MATDRSATRHREPPPSAAVGNDGLLPPEPAVFELTPAMTLEDVGTRAVQRFLDTGDSRVAVEQYVAALFNELSQPYLEGWWRPRRRVRSASEQLDIVMAQSAKFYERAAHTLTAKNTLAEALIKHATTQQRYQLQRVTHAAAIAEQKQRKAEAQAAALRAKQEFRDQQIELGVMKMNVQTAQWEVDHMREVNESLGQQLNAATERAADLARQLDEDKQRAAHQPAEEQRAQQLAEEQHQTRLAEQRLQRALSESRIQGLQEPDNARRRRAQRHAARETRETQDRTWLLDEYARKAEREIKRAEKKHGPDSEVVNHIRNQWNARLEELATTDNGGPE